MRPALSVGAGTHLARLRGVLAGRAEEGGERHQRHGLTR